MLILVRRIGAILAVLCSTASAAAACPPLAAPAEPEPTPAVLRVALVALVAAWVAAITVLASGTMRPVPDRRLHATGAVEELARRRRRTWFLGAALLCLPTLALPMSSAPGDLAAIAAIAAACALVPLAFGARAHAALELLRSGEGCLFASDHHVVVAGAGRRIWLRASAHALARLAVPPARIVDRP